MEVLYQVRSTTKTNGGRQRSAPAATRFKNKAKRRRSDRAFVVQPSPSPARYDSFPKIFDRLRTAPIPDSNASRSHPIENVIFSVVN
jgi:hypothetical protein